MFGLIVQQVTHAARETTNDIGRWRGHRLFYVDGTGVSMPDTPALAQAFGYPGSVKPGCGFPVMHGLFLFDAATGLIVDLVFSHGHTHDAAVATRVHPSLEPGDVLLAISGSGNSPNVLNAVNWANRHEMKTFGLTGYEGGKLKDMQQEISAQTEALSSLLGQLTRCLGCCLGRAELLAMLPLGLFLNRRAAVRSAAEGDLKR